MDLLRNVCRVCLESPGEVSIFRFQNTITKLRCCTPMTKIEKNNGLPEELCTDCAKSLNDAYKFYTKCAKSNTKLQNLLLGRNINTGRGQVNNVHKIENELLMVIGAQPYLKRKHRNNASKNKKPIVVIKGKRKQKETKNEEVDREYVEKMVKEEVIFEEIDWFEEYCDEIEQDPKDLECDRETNDAVYTEECREIDEENAMLDKYFNKPQSVEHRSRNTNENRIIYLEEIVKSEEYLHDIIETVATNEEHNDDYTGQDSNTADKMEEYFNETKSHIKDPQSVNLGSLDTNKSKRDYLEQNLCVEEYLDKTEETSNEQQYIDHKADVTKAITKNSQKPLSHHVVTDHTRGCHSDRLENKGWQCVYCSKKFSTNNGLKIHTIRVHTNNKPHQCVYCSQRFAILKDKRAHERQHTGEGQHRCKLCDKIYTELRYLKRHLQNRHGVHNYKEGRAEFKKKMPETKIQTNKKHEEKTNVASFDNVDLHCGEYYFIEGEKSEDTQEVSTDELGCSFCPFSCYDKRQLRLHINEHINEKFITLHKKSDEPHKFGKLPCEFCGKFISRISIGTHIKFAHVNKELKCEICKKVFRNIYSLKSHVNRIHKKFQNKSYQCDDCGKISTSKNGLQGHIIRKHTKLRPHKCTYCGKRFAQRNDHKQHERLHTNERPYQCPLCDKSYAQLCNMKSHFKHNHKEHNYKEAMAEFKNFLVQTNVG